MKFFLLDIINLTCLLYNRKDARKSSRELGLELKEEIRAASSTFDS